MLNIPDSILSEYGWILLIIMYSIGVLHAIFGLIKTVRLLLKSRKIEDKIKYAVGFVFLCFYLISYIYIQYLFDLRLYIS